MSANKPLEVLVIEDDAQMQNILVASLDEFGVTAYVAGNMLDALALARLKKYDFYITDGCYPLAPGKGAEEACFKFYKELKKIRPDAEVLLITGRNDFEREARKLGMDFLSKADFTKNYRDVFTRHFGPHT